MKETKSIVIFRPWFIAAMVLAVSGGLFSQWTWKTKIASGKQAEAIESWVRNQSVLINLIGRVDSVKAERTQATYSRSFGGDTSGFFHYTLTSARGTAEIWVTWHQDSSDQSPVIERLEITSNGRRKTIWSAAK